ncbi:MAG: hypothetical protein AAGJ35_14230, partial [Myxococcota bacterium]
MKTNKASKHTGNTYNNTEERSLHQENVGIQDHGWRNQIIGKDVTVWGSDNHINFDVPNTHILLDPTQHDLDIGSHPSLKGGFGLEIFDKSSSTHLYSGSISELFQHKESVALSSDTSITLHEHPSIPGSQLIVLSQPEKNISSSGDRFENESTADTQNVR